MDEADLLADHIAILAAPGKLIASGTPVALKRDLGEGYTVQVTFKDDVLRNELLGSVRAIAPETHTSSPLPHQVCYHLKSKDPLVVEKVLQLLDDEGNTHNVVSCDVLGTTIEDIFLDLMSKEEVLDVGEKVSRDTVALASSLKPGTMQLANGQRMSPYRQAFTIFHKRLLIARRSWLTPLLTVLIAIAGACIPLVFMSGRQQSCIKHFDNATSIPLYLPSSFLIPFTLGYTSRVAVSPPEIISTLGSSTDFFRVTNLPDNASFVNYIEANYRNLSLGGVSFDLAEQTALVAWEASSPGFTSASMLNLASNVLYNNALNMSGNTAKAPTLIRATYSPFPPTAAGTLFSLKWVVFFGAVMVRHVNIFHPTNLTVWFAGRLSCILCAIRVKGKKVFGSGHAAFERLDRSNRTLARSSDI